MKNKGYFGGRSQKEKKRINTVILTAIVIIIIFIPTIIALVNAFAKANASENIHMEVSLYSGDELLYQENSDTNEASFNSLVNVFDTILNEMKEITHTPTDFNELTHMRAIITKNSAISEYNCYFSTDENLNYMVDSDNVVYKIPVNSAMKFISSPYAQPLYKNAAPPNLHSTSGDIIVPTSLEWKYKNVNGDIFEAQNLTTNAEYIEYDMAGSLGLTFDVEPDDCTVIIKKSGTPWDAWRKGSHVNLPLISVETGTTLQFEVTAVWNESPERDFCGTVDYKFNVIVRDRAEFILDKKELQAGDVILVSCTNIFDIDKLNFYSEPDIGYTPTFYKDGDMVYALIPFNSKLEANTYSLSFSYGATSETFSVDLTAADTPDKYYTVKFSNTDLFYDYIGEDSLGELGDILRNISPDYSEYLFCKEGFADYSQSSATVRFAYGSLFRPLAVDQRFALDGMVYQFGDGNGASVTALNSGIVASVGNCRFLGNYVIVEHGLGLRTVYGHLNSVNVEEGNSVIRGQSLGRTGKLNEYSEEDLIVMCYVYDVPVNYSKLAGKTIDFYVSENTEEQ